eukprot:2652273-Alexandrium_andersonii.AAC.1
MSADSASLLGDVHPDATARLGCVAVGVAYGARRAARGMLLGLAIAILGARSVVLRARRAAQA